MLALKSIEVESRNATSMRQISDLQQLTEKGEHTFRFG